MKECIPVNYNAFPDMFTAAFVILETVGLGIGMGIIIILLALSRLLREHHADTSE